MRLDCDACLLVSSRGRAAEAEELIELGDVRHQLIGTLSHGYRQRVGIAQAIVHHPSFVVLDEPIGGLDPVQIVEMRSLVRGLRGERTVVVSSHILHEISETCDRILVIRDGGDLLVGNGASDIFAAFAGIACCGHACAHLPVVATGLKIRLERWSARSRASTRWSRLLPRRRTRRWASILVTMTSDIRDELCRAIVGAGLGLLEVTRQREEEGLERMFLELVGETVDGEKRRKKRARSTRAEGTSGSEKSEEPS